MSTFLLLYKHFAKIFILNVWLGPASLATSLIRIHQQLSPIFNGRCWANNPCHIVRGILFITLELEILGMNKRCKKESPVGPLSNLGTLLPKYLSNLIAQTLLYR